MVREYGIRYFNRVKEVLDAIDLDTIEDVVEILLKAYQNENQVFVMGNGGSGSTASHFACDINKGVSQPLLRRFKVISLNDNMPLIMAYANDLSYEEVFVEQIKNYLGPDDVVIGISGSGNSRNVLKAIEYANKNKAVTIGLSGFDGGQLAKVSQVNLNAAVSDMQQAEDIHLIITHLIMQVLQKRLS
jgi:D-sedoheptulose 7-phosphate isomerase